MCSSEWLTIWLCVINIANLHDVLWKCIVYHAHTHHAPKSNKNNVQYLRAKCDIKFETSLFKQNTNFVYGSKFDQRFVCITIDWGPRRWFFCFNFISVLQICVKIDSGSSDEWIHIERISNRKYRFNRQLRGWWTSDYDHCLVDGLYQEDKKNWTQIILPHMSSC